jgi:hypothetical protein
LPIMMSAACGFDDITCTVDLEKIGGSGSAAFQVRHLAIVFAPVLHLNHTGQLWRGLFVVYCKVLEPRRQWHIEANVATCVGSVIRTHRGIIQQGPELVEVFSSYPPSTIYPRCVSDRCLHAQATLISFIDASHDLQSLRNIN